MGENGDHIAEKPIAQFLTFDNLGLFSVFSIFTLNLLVE